MVHVGLSLMFEEPFRAAAMPLFEEGIVDAIEYSFEIGWAFDPAPEWIGPLLDHYAKAGRLWGHGVTMSPFSVHPVGRQTWLDRVEAQTSRRRFVGVSEHFGFMSADNLDGGAPLPVPPGPGARDAGIASLQALAAATGTPVGLENLALAFSAIDVLAQGPLLTEVLDAVDGYLVLDVHNLDCQRQNYDVDLDAVLGAYPLSRVRTIHVSGGSWTEAGDGGMTRRFRRDTHDDDVPDRVFDLLAAVVPRCPNLQAVTLERLGATLGDARSRWAFGDDYRRLRATVEESRRG